MGFPTANIDAPKEMEDGLYVGLANAKPSLIFVGIAQTFGETKRFAEVYILDFTGDLYDQEIEVEIIRKLRENMKFDSESELVEQMKADELLAREFFTSYNLSN